MSSVGARQGYERSSIYCGTKSMIESFTRCWAMYSPPPFSTSPFDNGFRLVNLVGNMAAQSMQSALDQQTLRHSTTRVLNFWRRFSPCSMPLPLDLEWALLRKLLMLLGFCVRRSRGGSQELVWAQMVAISWPEKILYSLEDRESSNWQHSTQRKVPSSSYSGIL